MARFDFHGLVIETATAFAGDPAARLLSALPPSRTGVPASLSIRSEPGTPDELEPRLPGPDAFVYGSNRIRIRGQLVELCWPGVRTTVDGAAVVARIDPEAVATVEQEELIAHGPLLMALAVALRFLGCYHLHAAALVLPGGASLLLPGLSGAGKSTLALALIGRGLRFLGDDTLFIRSRGDGTRLLALPRDFHLTERTATSMGLSGQLHPFLLTGAGKGRLDASRAFPGRFEVEAPAPAFILLPCITGEPVTRVETAGPAAALGALLESSALVATRGLPGGEGHLPVLASLADGATTFRVGLGLDLLSDPADTAKCILSGLRA